MDLTMPRLSDTMEEGTLGRWLKAEGETIEKGEVIAEIQTDKANMELEAFQGGVLERILVQEGETVPIGQAIAVIGSGKGGSDGSEPVRAPEERPAQEEPPAPAAAASTDGPAREATPARAGGPEGRIKASPLARRLAQEHGLELSALRGTGPNGRITRDDVEQALSSQQAPTQPPAPVAAQPQPVPAAPAAAQGDVQPFTRIQSIIARRMVESKTQVPHIYLTVEIDMSKAMRLREEINALGGQKVSFNDVVIKACAAALRAYPKANASYAPEGGIRLNSEVNVGFAVAQEGVLIVPVIRNADQKSLRQVASEARSLIEKARENRLSPQDLSGGTFTVSNLGMYGVEEFQAVINQPEAAILAVGAIQQKPVVQDGQVAVGSRMRVTISADHRVLYGADAAEFLRELKRLLEEPLNLGF
jgi:pyruvate dehydrogenase E2 component (dihydrolipoamide acetyltransferase)